METPRLYQILKEHEKREGSNPLLNSLYILLYIIKYLLMLK